MRPQDKTAQKLKERYNELGDIELVEEYGEDLNLDWKNTKGVEPEKRKKDRDED